METAGFDSRPSIYIYILLNWITGKFNEQCYLLCYSQNIKPFVKQY